MAWIGTSLVLSFTDFAECVITTSKRHKSPGIDEIPANLFKAEGRTICCEIHKLYSVRNKEELPEQWKQSVILLVYKQGKKTDGSGS
jgi:hypothetical protein